MDICLEWNKWNASSLHRDIFVFQWSLKKTRLGLEIKQVIWNKGLAGSDINRQDVNDVLMFISLLFSFKTIQMMGNKVLNFARGKKRELPLKTSPSTSCHPHVSILGNLYRFSCLIFLKLTQWFIIIKTILFFFIRPANYFICQCLLMNMIVVATIFFLTLLWQFLVRSEFMNFLCNLSAFLNLSAFWTNQQAS